MILFDKSQTSAELILTLSENVTVNEPVYDFVFTHVLTKKQVVFSLDSTNDISDFPERYNDFIIDTSPFTEPGEWHYQVNEHQTGIILEYGKLMITRDFNYTYYAGDTSYRAYNG